MEITEGQIFAPQISVEQQILVSSERPEGCKSSWMLQKDGFQSSFSSFGSLVLKPLKPFLFIAEGKSPFLTQYLFSVCHGAFYISKGTATAPKWDFRAAGITWDLHLVLEPLAVLFQGKIPSLLMRQSVPHHSKCGSLTHLFGRIPAGSLLQNSRGCHCHPGMGNVEEGTFPLGFLHESTPCSAGQFHPHFWDFSSKDQPVVAVRACNRPG